jgi:DNA-binding HxlR family transcriptional regulator
MRKKTSTNWRNEERLKATCGMSYTLSLIGDRWKGSILWALIKDERLRFSQLRDFLPGISKRMLAKQLGELEEDQLVNRIVYPEVPPRVEYELTDLGHSMQPILKQMSSWGEMHRDTVHNSAR